MFTSCLRGYIPLITPCPLPLHNRDGDYAHNHNYGAVNHNNQAKNHEFSTKTSNRGSTYPQRNYHHHYDQNNPSNNNRISYGHRTENVHNYNVHSIENVQGSRYNPSPTPDTSQFTPYNPRGQEQLSIQPHGPQTKVGVSGDAAGGVNLQRGGGIIGPSHPQRTTVPWGVPRTSPRTPVVPHAPFNHRAQLGRLVGGARLELSVS